MTKGIKSAIIYKNIIHLSPPLQPPLSPPYKGEEKGEVKEGERGSQREMIEIFNKKENKKRRQHLRKNMTKAEIFLWSRIKMKQLNGFKFRRQFGINNYIVDFYCPELKLAIEIDGDVHGYDSQIVSDKQRQRDIEALGIKVLRYTNNDIIQNIHSVLQDILSTTPAPLLRKEGK